MVRLLNYSPMNGRSYQSISHKLQLLAPGQLCPVSQYLALVNQLHAVTNAVGLRVCTYTWTIPRTVLSRRKLQLAPGQLCPVSQYLAFVNYQQLQMLYGTWTLISMMVCTYTWTIPNRMQFLNMHVQDQLPQSLRCSMSIFIDQCF